MGRTDQAARWLCQVPSDHVCVDPADGLVLTKIAGFDDEIIGHDHLDWSPGRFAIRLADVERVGG